MNVRRDENGAVAVIVALMSVALFVIASFAVDFGHAYTTKRQLSTAADSAALAAARYYATQSGNCTQLSNPLDPNYTSRMTVAKSTASQYLSDNIGGANLDDLTVSCSPDLKSLDVYFADSRSDTTALAGIAGVSKITTARSATAEVFVPSVGAGALPYMLCYSDIATLQLPGVQKLSYDKNTNACGYYGGNWYTVDCPEDSDNTDQKNLAKFCTDTITAFTTDPPNTYSHDTVAQASAHCDGQPYSGPEGCLRGNSGNIRGTTLLNFWDSILGDNVLMPVIYPGTVTGTGSKTNWPVVGFLAARICGYHWGPNNNQVSGTAVPDCKTTLTTSTGTSTDNYLLLAKSIYTSGGAALGHSGCAVGSPTCDGGNRAVSLIK